MSEWPAGFGLVIFLFISSQLIIVYFVHNCDSGAGLIK